MIVKWYPPEWRQGGMPATEMLARGVNNALGGKVPHARMRVLRVAETWFVWFGHRDDPAGHYKVWL